MVVVFCIGDRHVWAYISRGFEVKEGLRFASPGRGGTNTTREAMFSCYPGDEQKLVLPGLQIIGMG